MKNNMPIWELRKKLEGKKDIWRPTLGKNRGLIDTVKFYYKGKKFAIRQHNGGYWLRDYSKHTHGETVGVFDDTNLPTVTEIKRMIVKYLK